MLILFLVVLVLLAGPALAQPPAGQPVPSLKPVVVEGARVPDERRETEQEARKSCSGRPARWISWTRRGSASRGRPT